MTLIGEEPESELHSHETVITGGAAAGARGRAQLHAQTEGSRDSKHSHILYLMSYESDTFM